jgi:hypothetical protein
MEIICLAVCADWKSKLPLDVQVSIPSSISAWDETRALRFANDKKFNALMALTAPILRVNRKLRMIGLNAVFGQKDYPPVWLRPSKPQLLATPNVWGVPWFEDPIKLEKTVQALPSVRHWTRMVLTVKIPWTGMRQEIDKLRGLLEKTESLRMLFLRIELRPARRGPSGIMTRAAAWEGVLQQLGALEELKDFQFVIDVRVHSGSEIIPSTSPKTIKQYMDLNFRGQFQVRSQSVEDVTGAVAEFKDHLYHIYRKCGKGTRMSLLPEELEPQAGAVLRCNDKGARLSP